MTPRRALIILAALWLAPIPAAAGPRASLPLTTWTFAKGDSKTAQAPGFDDRAWATVRLPHTYNAADGADGGGYYRGPAWYRARLVAPARKAGQRAFLEFDGAALVSDVWVNGRPVGRHAGGYAGFRFDVSELIVPGPNLVTVRVDNASNTAVAPLGGDFTVFGGLYRPVRLVVTDAIHVDMLDHGGPGVYATPSAVSAEGADLSVLVRVRNDQSGSARVAVRSRLLDAGGKTVATLSRTLDVAPGTVTPVTLTAHVTAPRLWRGRADPYLYRLVTTVGDDTVTVPVGFRSIAVDPARGLLLNGQPYGVHGVNLFHAGRPAKGLAVGDAEVDEDFAILRDLGATGLRFVHFQHPRRAYQDADRDGFLVWTEIPLNSVADDGPAFAANAAEQLRELISQNYNHPSVVTWGLANELYRSDAATAKLLSGLQAVAKAEDPSRPTALADCCKPETDPQALHTDLIGQNRYFGWYDGKPEDIGPWAEAVHAKSPGRPLAISEYGAGASVLQQEDPPRRPVAKSKWHPEQYQALFHETYWRALRDKPWLWGTFVWVGFDLASDGRDEGDHPGINDKGLVTYDRKTRKDAYYWYRANWTTAPMVRITSRRAVARSTAGVTVKVYANVPSVSLRLNGRDLGPAPVLDHVATWPVTLAPGVNHIAVEGGGARDAVTWVLAPAGK